MSVKDTLRTCEGEKEAASAPSPRQLALCSVSASSDCHMPLDIETGRSVHGTPITTTVGHGKKNE